MATARSADNDGATVLNPTETFQVSASKGRSTYSQDIEIMLSSNFDHMIGENCTGRELVDMPFDTSSVFHLVGH